MPKKITPPSEVPKQAAKKKIVKFRPEENLSRFLFKILKKDCEGSAEMGISTKGMTNLNSMILDVYRKISRTAGGLGRGTLKAYDIQTATKLCLPGELGRYAVEAATTAVVKFQASH